MSKYSGRLAKLAVAKESSRGVGVAPAMRLPHTEYDFKVEVKDARIGPSLGYLADSEERVVLSKLAAGSIKGEVRDQSFGYLLYALLGTCNTTGPLDTTAYTHAFTLNNAAQHTTLSLYEGDANNTYLYEMAALEELEMTCPVDDVARFSAKFRSRVAQTTTQSIPAQTSEQKFAKNKVVLKIAANIAGLAAATGLSIKGLTLTFKKKLVDEDVNGTTWPEDFLVTNFSIEGKFDISMDGATYRDYFLNGDTKAIQLVITGGSVITGAASTYPSLTIQLPKVDFHVWEKDNSLDEIVKQTVSFKANRDVANAQDIIYACSLVNGKTSY